MANRRYGQGNRPQYGAVNPWEGGSFPGNRGGAFNSGNSGAVLSHLSEPQAQLAIALSKLLQPQQSQVPSLLAMDPIIPSNSYDYSLGRTDFNRRNRNDFRRNEPFSKVCFW